MCVLDPVFLGYCSRYEYCLTGGYSLDILFPRSASFGAVLQMHVKYTLQFATTTTACLYFLNAVEAVMAQQVVAIEALVVLYCPLRAFSLFVQSCCFHK